MLDLCRLIAEIVTDLFRSRAALEAELLVLRQQIKCCGEGRRRGFGLERLQAGVGRCLSIVSKGVQCSATVQAGHGHPLAPRRISIVLALEVEMPSWSPDDLIRNSSTDPA